MSSLVDEKLQEVLSDKIDKMYFQKQEEAPVVKTEDKSEEIEEVDETEEGEDIKIEKDDSAEDKNAPEAEKEITDNEEDQELDRRLSGYAKEFKYLVKTEKDPVKREQLFQAVKVARAREDRLNLELGNSKKEIANFKDFGDLLRNDPKLAIKNLAKRLNLDINSLVEKAVPESDEYDYRTPEEISRDKKLADIEQELSQLKNQKQLETNLILDQEIDSFENAKDDKGNLKHPHYEKVHSSMIDLLAFEKQKFGFPKTSLERLERLEKAYKKAVLLDDDLVALRDAEILKRAELKRKREIEEARKNKKFKQGNSVNIDTTITDSRARLEKALEHFF